MASPDENKPRPMTGFWAHLTPEQKAKALAYRGPENHGDRAFLENRKPPFSGSDHLLRALMLIVAVTMILVALAGCGASARV